MSTSLAELIVFLFMSDDTWLIHKRLIFIGTLSLYSLYALICILATAIFRAIGLKIKILPEVYRVNYYLQKNVIAVWPILEWNSFLFPQFFVKRLSKQENEHKFQQVERQLVASWMITYHSAPVYHVQVFPEEHKTDGRENGSASVWSSLNYRPP